jgi:phosphoglycolate phosphatase-like HAD superfamily hydrolase
MKRLWAAAFLALCVISANVQAADHPLPSWNDGAAKSAINEFVHATTDQSSPNFVPPEERITTFDQDGTLWVEHPIYTQVIYCLDRVPAVVKEKPDLAKVEPFKTALSGNREVMAKLSINDLLKILAATSTGMSVDEFAIEVKKWLVSAKDARWRRPYTELTYLPMIELLKYLRANGYRTYIVTGGGQDFVRVYSEQVYGIPPEQVVGTAGGTSYSYDKNGRPFLTKDPKLLLNDNFAGKPEGIHMMIGRGPTPRSVTRPATRRCWSIPRPAMARGWRCWYRTTTQSANTPMARHWGCPTPRSAPSPRPCTTRRRNRAGSSSA